MGLRVSSRDLPGLERFIPGETGRNGFDDEPLVRLRAFGFVFNFITSFGTAK